MSRIQSPYLRTLTPFSKLHRSLPFGSCFNSETLQPWQRWAIRCLLL